MSTSPKAEGSTESEAGPSRLTLREQLRLKAQQKLTAQAASTTKSSGRIDLSALPDTVCVSDEEELGSLTLGRVKRKAALNRPATYSIDPTDDASRLHSHPNQLPESAAKHALTSYNRTKGVGSLIREQQKRIKRGTDADGFSRAEAIARSMEQERLGKMGIAYDAEDDEKAGNERTGETLGATSSKMKPSIGDGNGDGKEQKLTVRALSPTISSFLWSSQSEGAYSYDDTEPDPDATIQKQKLAASLAAVDANEGEKQQTLSILQRDVRDSIHTADKNEKGHLTFYRPSRSIAPLVESFCPLPSIAQPALFNEGESSSTSPPASITWETISPHVLLAGTLPPALNLERSTIRRILLWTAISYTLERDVLRSHRLSSLFTSLIHHPSRLPYARELEQTIPRALSDIVRRIPRILNRIGVDEEVIEQSFPDNANVTDEPCILPRRRTTSSGTKATQTRAQGRGGERSAFSSPSVEFKVFKVYLTQTEQDDIMINLAKVLGMVISAVAEEGFVEEHLSVLAGYVACMAVACASCTNANLQSEVGVAITGIFGLASKQSKVQELQEAVCRRTFTALGNDSSPSKVALRARLVSVFPGQSREIGAVIRWLAWCVLTEHLAQYTPLASAVSRVIKEQSKVVPSSDPVEAAGNASQEQEREARENAHWRIANFEPLQLELDVLVKAVDVADAKSPFYVVGESGGGSRPIPTQRRGGGFETIIAATQLLAVALRDLPIHLCTFSSDSSSANTGSKGWPRALRLALAPYAHLNPQLDESRIDCVRNIITRLANVNSKIRDNRGDVILRSLAKDLLQRTGHALEYQLQMYDSNSGLGDFIK
ncbi:uncharacterized protein UHOD_03154 [Ustilago sp. UG-2017b]|nr:uncharacterized protein UHOD_03154 [Ustilago sp. UG-2017b]